MRERARERIRGQGAAGILTTPTEEAIPTELKGYRQWVVWRREMRDGKPTKRPYNSRDGRAASVTNPGTWSTFEQARAVAHQYDGPGFVFNASDPFFGTDFDKCRNPQTGEIAPRVRKIITALNSYTEISPSGTGLHIIALGTLPPGWRKRGGIELYDRARFFTMTGDHLPGTPTTIEERTEAIAALHARLSGTPPTAVTQPSQTEPATVPERWLRLVETNPRVAAAWQGEDKELRGREGGSGLDMRLAHEIRRYGFSLEEARRILAAAPYPVGGGRSAAYLDRTIARAFQAGRRRALPAYGAVPAAVVDSGAFARLHPATKALLFVLFVRRMRPSGTVLRSAQNLARDAGISPRSVGPAGAQLEAEGWISRERVAGGRMLYRVHFGSPTVERGVSKPPASADVGEAETQPGAPRLDSCSQTVGEPSTATYAPTEGKRVLDHGIGGGTSPPVPSGIPSGGAQGVMGHRAPSEVEEAAI